MCNLLSLAQQAFQLIPLYNLYMINRIIQSTITNIFLHFYTESISFMFSVFFWLGMFNSKRNICPWSLGLVMMDLIWTWASHKTVQWSIPHGPAADQTTSKIAMNNVDSLWKVSDECRYFLQRFEWMGWNGWCAQCLGLFPFQYSLFLAKPAHPQIQQSSK